MFGGFEWPEFKPGDRVYVHPPSLEDPLHCACFATRAESIETHDPGAFPSLGFVLRPQEPRTTQGCSECGASPTTIPDDYIDVEMLNLNGRVYAASPTSLELLEAADE